MYDKSKFTYGFEIEWGDVDRRLEVPAHLGKWEYSETDIVNVREPYAYVACDPLGISPPFGGEINTVPTATWQAQVDRIMEIHDFFVASGNVPHASCMSHNHLHMYVPGLKDDIDALKRLTKYIKENQHLIIEKCGGYYDNSFTSSLKGSKAYFKLDGGRPMPDYMSDNIINLATDFASFIKLHCAGKDGVSMGRPFRFGINTYCMKHTGTIEFRFFRCSTKREEIADQFRWAEMFMDAALNTGKPMSEIFEENEFNFPPFRIDPLEYRGWVETKWDKERGKKVREYINVS